MINNLNQSLADNFGFNDFRPGQQETIAKLLEGKSSLAIFPTGSGKSLCYQFTALHLPHLTLVVSPLLALMKDQLEFLSSKGIAAASIDSSLSPEQNNQVMSQVRTGQLKVLMISVERFKNERFRQFISSVNISMLVVDEAHCISEWGHNFRPDYLKLPAYKKSLNIPLTLLLTATATKKVKLDMAAKFAIDETDIIQTGFYRSNLNLAVVSVTEQAKNSELLAQVTLQKGVGIVYVTLQQTAEQVAQFLQQNNINAQAYHAGFESDKRQTIQQDFMQGRVQVIVATIAFGMGIDKSDVRFVIHYDLPKSIENYSQEIGRAGRDNLPSNCITLANLDGLTTVENFVYGDTPEKAEIDTVLTQIKAETVPENNQAQWSLQGLSLSTTSNIKQLPLKTLLVQLELAGVIKPLYSYFAEFKFKFLTDETQIIAAFTGERGAFLSAVFRTAKRKKVWHEPDFDKLYQEYQSDRSRVITALEYLNEKGFIALETKKITDVYQVNIEKLNDENLSPMLSQYYADKEKSEINRIAALIRFFQLDKCLTHNLSRYFDDQAAPLNCHHCSVCHGQVAKLSRSLEQPWPSDEVLYDNVQSLIHHLRDKTALPISITIATKFLTGLSAPIFTRNKVRQLSGFASCEQQSFAKVKEKVEQLKAAMER